jgi:hypothetical protein
MKDLVACYEQLSALLHSYYLLIQWHRDPFSLRNADIQYLHRCNIHAAPTAPSTTPSTSSLTPSSSCRQSHEHADDPNVAQDQILSSSLYVAHIGMAFWSHRKLVWENMQHCVSDLLDRLPNGMPLK